jgi:23S rRNA (cytosine1962-C5)-methyltransferase
MTHPALVLKSGREKPVLAYHPWIFSGAIDQIKGTPEAGDTIEILDSRGKWIARAAYSPVSNIRARIWTWVEDEIVDKKLLLLRIQKAVRLRMDLGISLQSDAYRLVHGESDGLPGLIVDRYADVMVMQLLSAGMEKWKNTLVDCLIEGTGLDTVFERSDVDVRKLEGMEERVGLVKGKSQDDITIQENGLRFRVDIVCGQKTGFFLDQRVNRKRLGELAHGKVLNCFSYSAAFSVYALKGKATAVTSVDSSAKALELGGCVYLPATFAR